MYCTRYAAMFRGMNFIQYGYEEIYKTQQPVPCFYPAVFNLLYRTGIFWF